MKNTSEREVAKLFEKEIEYYRAIEQLREEFIKNFGFVFGSVISEVDRQRRGGVNVQDLVGFIQQHGVDFSKEEFEAICRKVRARDQGQLSHKELMRAFSPFEPLNFPTYRKDSHFQRALDYITEQVKGLDIDATSPYPQAERTKTHTGFQRVMEEFRDPQAQTGHLSSNYFYDKNYYNELRQYKTAFFDPNKEVKKRGQGESVGPQYHDHFFGDYFLYLEERNKMEHYYNKFGKRYAFENNIGKTLDSRQ